MSRPQFQLGGQALVEGVMMRGPTHVGAAVRRADGTIQTRVEPFTSILRKKPFLNVPFFRGVIALFEMMALGMGYLNWSSNLALEDEQTKTKAAKAQGKEVSQVETVPLIDPLVAAPVPVPVPVVAVETQSTVKAENKPPLPLWLFLLTVAGSFTLGVGLFVALPNVITDKIFEPLLGTASGWSVVALNLLEGTVKLAIFVSYVYLIGRRPDIKRIFEYHGAEHKVVFAAENNRPITPEGARPFDTPHPRCGTGFALLTVFVSMLCFSFLPWTESDLWRVGMRLLLLPVIAGISYEIIKATVNPRFSALATLVITPGMWLQRLTTVQPDDDQLEVACEAMRVLLEQENKAIPST